MSRPAITLILPEFSNLLIAELNQGLQPAFFKKIISKSTFKVEPHSLEKWIFNAFYPQTRSMPDLPFAAMQHHAYKLCVSPCYVHADQGCLLLFHRDIGLTETDSKALLASIAPLFEGMGELKYQETKRWFFSSEKIPDIQCHAITELEGHSVLKFLPHGNEAADWTKLWNEVQMLLFEHPINQAREQRGERPINSVWFWGGGVVPPQTQVWERIIGRHSVLDLLSQRSKTQLEAFTLAELQLGKKETLIVAPELNWHADLEEQLMALDKALFKPLWAAMRKGLYRSVLIQIPEWGEYRLSPLATWKFW